MKFLLDRRDNSVVAVLEGPVGCIQTPQDALDLMAEVRFHHQCGKIAIQKQCLPEEFFRLETGLAGEILQKYTTYGIIVAIVGDFSGYNSKSLRDFIYESNKGGKTMFLPTLAEALDRLHSITQEP